ncbi:hypothetical protein L210DRAFT_950659 [Boletus edulis BED1]|uniref:Uncharacterized protein n=1 Tax=Boletus edulis BED1 TaxID=1328754 RepID=A0AAD4G707_BOLED|nr:hypothetical protein L210DRAFT_950659 [Boletus edulis BED1]
MGATYLPPLIPTDVVRPLNALTTSLKPGIRDLYFVVRSTTLSVVVELGIDNVRVTRPSSIDDILQGLPWNRHASAGLTGYSHITSLELCMLSWTVQRPTWANGSDSTSFQKVSDVLDEMCTCTCKRPIFKRMGVSVSGHFVLSNIHHSDQLCMILSRGMRVFNTPSVTSDGL